VVFLEIFYKRIVAYYLTAKLFRAFHGQKKKKKSLPKNLLEIENNFYLKYLKDIRNCNVALEAPFQVFLTMTIISLNIIQTRQVINKLKSS
jgi:hypothetical protein